MRFNKIFALVIGAAILATPTMAAQPKNLFETLFPKLKEQRLKRERAKLPIVEVEKVSAPKIFTYRVEGSKDIVLENAGRTDGLPEFLAGSEHGSRFDLAFSDFQVDVAMVGMFVTSGDGTLAGAVSEYYKTAPAYAWLSEDGKPNSKSRSVMKLFESAAEFGLRVEDYRVPNLSSATFSREDKANQRLQFELAMSLAALRYGMDARFGTINPNKLSGYHDFPERKEEPPKVLAEILDSGLPANTLRDMHPNNSKFAALKRELEAMRNTDGIKIALKTDVLIKPGMEHEEVPNLVDAIEKRGSEALLKKYSDLFSSYSGEREYTPELVELVKSYQAESNLKTDGVVGRMTTSRLVGVGPESSIRRLTMAMERLRWLPHELGKRHVFINQPAYRAIYIENGAEKLSMRAIVGKPSNQTSFFYDEIEQVVYNPYWGVPRSIIVNEMLPKLREDPSYLDALGYELTDSRGKRVASSTVDWYQVGSNPGFDVRQPPGGSNALGRVKILFPNKHAIYMHDTPSRHLFQRDQRALSHGCVRLQKPQEMAAAVLGKTKNYVKSQISTGKNITERVPQKFPVYVSYFTAWPNTDGTIGYYPDIYGRDGRLETAMQITANARNALLSF